MLLSMELRSLIFKAKDAKNAVYRSGDPPQPSFVIAKKQLSGATSQDYLFPNRNRLKLTRLSVTQRLALAVDAAVAECPQLSERTISPHTFRHTTAMHLLQSGVDVTVIALWLGHESPATTHMYIEADISMKERALSKLQPIKTSNARYRPPDQLMQFLQSL